MGASVALSGCVLEPVPFEGLECPCAQGWSCDPVTRTCVRGMTSDPCGRSGAAPGVVGLSALRGDWVTANQARISWNATQLEELFAYEVDVAASQEALLAGDLLRTVTSADNPELARSWLLNAESADSVLATTLWGLDPDTSYRVRVVAEDSSGNVSCTENIGVRTHPDPVRAIRMANESDEGVGTLPACVTFESDASGAASGEHFWQWVAACERESDGGSRPVCAPPAEPAPACWENVRVNSLDLAIDLSEGEFQRGFLELYLSISGTDHGYWGEVGLSTPSRTDPSAYAHWTLGQITLAAEVGYRRYQLPLAVLHNPGGTLDAGELNLGLRAFRVGTLWQTGAIVRIDDAVVRW